MVMHRVQANFLEGVNDEGAILDEGPLVTQLPASPHNRAVSLARCPLALFQ
jgi:hypothetical protein